MSVVAHAAVIVAAVVGTARADVAARIIEVPEEIVYTAPVERPERRAPEPTRAPEPESPQPPPETPQLPTVPTVPVPTVVPDGLPDVPTHVLTITAGTEVVLGGPATTGASDGTGSSVTSGGPDAGGTWDAHTVEVPVRPDPRNPAPTYPEMLRVAGMGGRVLAEFVVDTTGRVRQGSFVAVSTTHDLFTMSVRRTVASLRFTPALVQGRRVPQRVRVPFEFALR